MKLSTRSRYGMRGALELALEYGGGALQIKAIAGRQDISVKYLEQIMALLRSAGIIRSIRGPKGGYVLARHPDQIKLSEVFIALEGSAATVECLEHEDLCPRCASCVTKQVWEEMQNAMMNVLESMTLQELVDRVRKKGNETVTYQI